MSYTYSPFHVLALAHRMGYVHSANLNELPASLLIFQMMTGGLRLFGLLAFQGLKLVAFSVPASAQAAQVSWARHVRLGTITS